MEQLKQVYFDRTQLLFLYAETHMDGGMLCMERSSWKTLEWGCLKSVNAGNGQELRGKKESLSNTSRGTAALQKP